MAKKIVLYLILAASVIGMIVFGRKIYLAAMEYKQGSDIYSEVADIAYGKQPSATETPVIPAISVTPDVTDIPDTPETSQISDTAAYLAEDPHSSTVPEGTSAAHLEDEDRITETAPGGSAAQLSSAMDFTSLKEINSDVKGWIHLNDSKIDYPILQYRDNDFYLHHAITGDWNKVGTPYIDYRCAGDFSDRITVVYGHYMENGTMFTDFHKYKGQKYYEEHPVIDLYTPAGDYDVIPVAGVFQNVEYWDFTFDFPSDEAFLHYIDNWKAVSSFKSDEVYDASDRFVVLTLCTYDIENGRYLLVGKLVPRK
ncbi:MAG: class B sortase [Anaerolineaceae bacterium]|nr:class B sortase [Anaerolineaceae bacterium]